MRKREGATKNMGIIDVVVTGYVRGEPREIGSYENPGGMRGGWENVKHTYRIFEIDTIEAIEGADVGELENKRALVYPRTDETLNESGLSSYEQMLLLEGGNGNSGLPDHLEIYGTFEKADKAGAFAGTINAWKVKSLKEEGPQYREGKKEPVELLLKKE